jgi:hypothetical protein
MKLAAAVVRNWTAFRDGVLNVYPKEERIAWLWSALVLASIAALLPTMPLVACLLVIQWLFSSTFRRAIAATMLSLITVYMGIMYLTVRELWIAPWYEISAMLLAVFIGFIGRWTHQRMARIDARHCNHGTAD